MPSNPLFILLFMVVAFIVASIILVPIFNKGNRSKINRVIKDVYDVDDKRDISRHRILLEFYKSFCS